MLGSVASLFAQFVAGYTGFSVERRGHRVERQAAWSLLELQELLDEWIVVVFTDQKVGFIPLACCYS
jgi:putative transposase